jgi:hypothetical protein
MSMNLKNTIYHECFFSTKFHERYYLCRRKNKNKKVYYKCVFSHGIIGEIWRPQKNEKEERKFIIDVFLLMKFHEKYCV